MKREAVFANQGWYPKDATKAKSELESFLLPAKKTHTHAVIAPHAGWTFSGLVIGKLFSEIIVPDTVVLLCPMHRAIGSRVAVWASGSWDTPLGELLVHEDFANTLIKNFPLAKEDYESHISEHAIEILLPFIKHANKNAKIIPIRVGHLSYNECVGLSATISQIIKDMPGEVLVVASSDMSHESDYELVKKNDNLAKAEIMKMNTLGLMDIVEEHSITMCGYIPATIAMLCAKQLGAKQAKELDYTTSADVSGSYDYVVGYLAARFDG